MVRLYANAAADLASNVIDEANADKTKATPLIKIICCNSADIGTAEKAFDGHDHVMFYDSEEDTITYKGKEYFVPPFKKRSGIDMQADEIDMQADEADMEVYVAALVIAGLSTAAYDKRGLYDKKWVEDIASQVKDDASQAKDEFWIADGQAWRWWHSNLPRPSQRMPPQQYSGAQIPSFVVPSMWQESVASLYEGGLPTDGIAYSQGNTWDFIKALVNLIQPSKSSEMAPHTFLFDEDRLIKLRSDLLDLINLEICMDLYHILDAKCILQDTYYGAADDTPISSRSPADSNTLSSPTVPELHHFATSRPKHPLQERGHRIPWDKDGHITTSPISSPRSPLSSTTSTPDAFSPTPIYPSQPFVDSASQVRTSLLTILSSSTTNDKWAALVPSLALQILRSTTTPLTHFPQFESHLTSHLSNFSSNIYQDTETRVLTQLFPVLQKLVENYMPLTSLQIFEAATVPRILPGATPAQGNGSKEEITEIATRIAHLGILH
jgi:hypothetical protein